MEGEIVMSIKQKLLNEGKTKKIWETKEKGVVIIESKDDLTAGDGVKHDIVQGKAAFATATTCNVFNLLKQCKVPVAFIEQTSAVTFNSQWCCMLPFEVVIRREAHGSYLKRAPYLHKGHLFPKLKVEFFLKTSNKKWREYDLVCDDPLMEIDLEGMVVHLYDPKISDMPQMPSKPFLTLFIGEVFDENVLISSNNVEAIVYHMSHIAQKTFLILEKAWQLQNRRLVDFKVEFGHNSNGRLLLADVVDNDSWRVLENGKYIDKQLYRDGTSLDVVIQKYQQVAELTGRFDLPQQQLIIWKDSKNDVVGISTEELVSKYAVTISEVICCVHTEPIRAYQNIIQLVQDVPDSVLVYVGRSNGAGPTLSAQVTVPVITALASFKEFPEDICSSLRTASDSTVTTILEPKNAVLAALQILAMRNPQIYAELRLRQEERLCNIGMF